MKKKTKCELFLELAKPDKAGFSHKVFITDFVGEYAPLIMGNGGDWCRTDGTLGKKYNIKRHKEKGKIVYVELRGYRKNITLNAINPTIKSKLSGKPCVLTGTTQNIEVDHKDGRKDNYGDSLELSDFQPLNKTANNIKREACKKCKNTNKRFDATALGYCAGWIYGDVVYDGTCVGCLWYDIKEFHKEISDVFAKNKISSKFENMMKSYKCSS